MPSLEYAAAVLLSLLNGRRHRCIKKTVIYGTYRLIQRVCDAGNKFEDDAAANCKGLQHVVVGLLRQRAEVNINALNNRNCVNVQLIARTMSADKDKSKVHKLSLKGMSDIVISEKGD